ncbi:hypothetical protein [Sphingobacterium wenxiniae]|uniref:Lipoprotein n=1 Tax=Sphingobacterium wenxiniae TaxID=683125 RepID=A0A1I6UIX4_9SPHI|nr:hypothetical protein [Sphingobacterium wenxiniae]SFT01380.1 hypothetical protein SAMN05660206_10927 [Sphingobacterium wenxiniae]
MKKKWFYLLMLCIGCFFVTSCLEDLFDDGEDEEEGLSLSCGSVLPSGYQCISPITGAKHLANYHISELYGTWHSEDFGFCVQYSGDGTGKIITIAKGLHPGAEMNIKWGVMVNGDGSYAQSDGNGSVRVIHEGIGEPIDPQIAMLTFRLSTKQFYGFDLLRVGSCPKGSGGNGSNGNTNNGGNNGTANNGGNTGNSNGNNSGSGTGKVAFWVASDLGCGNITVTLNTGQQGTISSYYSSGTPSCGSSGNANFTLDPGTYSFSASCSKYNWKGNFTVEKDGCLTNRLWIN